MTQAMTLLALLAAIAIALQVATASPSFVDARDPAVSAGRRRFLQNVAELVVFVTAGVALWAAVPALVSSAPRVLDVRAGGMLLVALLVAVLAADATEVAERPVDRASFRAAQRRLRLRRLEAAARAWAGGGRPPSLAWQVLVASGMVLAAPALILVARRALLSEWSLVAAAAGLAVGVVVIALVWWICLCAAQCEWSDAAFAIVVGGGTLALVTLGVVAAVLDGVTPREGYGELLTVVLALAVPAAAAVTALGCDRRGRRRPVQHWVVLFLVRAIRRPVRVTTPVSGTALASVVCAPLFPVGLVLAHAALRQIEVARTAGSMGGGIRGRGLVRAARLISWSIPGVVIVALAGAAALSSGT